MNLPVDSPYMQNKIKVIIAKGDSGTTNYYWYTKDKYYLSNLKNNNTTKVTLSNTQAIQSTKKRELALFYELSPEA